MHRVILGLKSKERGDHIDGNGLNNQRHNLRRCSIRDNVRNQQLHTNNASGYKGVSFYKAYGRWSARITVDRDSKFLGYHATREAAAMAYNEAAQKYFGEFARLNLLPGEPEATVE